MGKKIVNLVVNDAKVEVSSSLNHLDVDVIEPSPYGVVYTSESAKDNKTYIGLVIRSKEADVFQAVSLGALKGFTKNSVVKPWTNAGEGKLKLREDLLVRITTNPAAMEFVEPKQASK